MSLVLPAYRQRGTGDGDGGGDDRATDCGPHRGLATRHDRNTLRNGGFIGHLSELAAQFSTRLACDVDRYYCRHQHTNVLFPRAGIERHQVPHRVLFRTIGPFFFLLDHSGHKQGHHRLAFALTEP
ncbi:hypothetical protein D3C80_1656430 [compost metagenome]